ncbi:MAG TPA: alpha-amylase family glycosyl hydrolase [Ktedonobacterales bacterium]
MTPTTQTPITDYFFGPYVTPQEQRLRFVAKNGVQHASVITPNDPTPGVPVELAIASDAALPVDHIAVYFTSNGDAPSGARGVAESGEVVLATREATSSERIGATPVHRWRATIPAQADGTMVRYRIDGWSDSDVALHWLADALDPFTAPAPTGREFAYHVDRRIAPEWTRDAIIYHIFVDRFATAHDQPPIRDPGSLLEFYGGTIRGITEKLDYIASLGVNCVWLSPIMETPTYHGYNPTSYADVAKHFGTNQDLKDFIAAAHMRGIRVLLDLVANHTSDEHPAFLAAIAGKMPTEDAWYSLGPAYDGGYLAYYGVKNMPVLRTDKEAVRTYIIEAARHWLTEFGADGLRLDNVSGPAHAFWTFFQEGVKVSHPDALTLGEVSGGMKDIDSYAGRLDACMDFPLTKVMRQVFAQRAAPLNDLLTMLEAQEHELPALMSRARALDNHDMHRFLWLAEGDTDRLKLALAFLMLAPGFPILYYGTEVGLSQRQGPAGQDAYAREPIPWGNEQRADVLDYTRRVISLRASTVSLRRGATARVPVSVTQGEAAQVGAFARWTGDEYLLAVFNNGKEPAEFSVDAQRPAGVAPAAKVEVMPIALTPSGESTLARTYERQPSGILSPMSVAVFRWHA